MKIPFLGGIGVLELVIILVVVLLIFGPKNLPKLGNAIGRTFKSLRDGMDGKKKESEPKTEAKKADDKEDVVIDEVVEVDEGAENPADAKQQDKNE